MNFYFDTEFQEDGRLIELISIGIVGDDGREYYAVNGGFQEYRASDWVRKHVLNHIGRTQVRKNTDQIAWEVGEFLKPCGNLWGWYPSYDWVALCQLFGPMVNKPERFPKRPNCLRQLRDMVPLIELPKQTGTVHNALEDARWVRDSHQHIIKALGTPYPNFNATA